MTTWRSRLFEIRSRLIGGPPARPASVRDRIDEAILFSRWPESMMAFDPNCGRTAEQARRVVANSLGFGQSHRRNLSPRGMGEYVAAATDAFGLGHAASVGTPVRIFAGDAETAVPPINATFVHTGLTRSNPRVIAAGHFTSEDAAADHAKPFIGRWRRAGNGPEKGGAKT